MVLRGQIVFWFSLWEDVVFLKCQFLGKFYLEVYDGLKRTDFEQFSFWESMFVLKELIVNNFLFERLWWS